MNLRHSFLALRASKAPEAKRWRATPVAPCEVTRFVRYPVCTKRLTYQPYNSFVYWTVRSIRVDKRRKMLLRLSLSGQASRPLDHEANYLSPLIDVILCRHKSISLLSQPPVSSYPLLPKFCSFLKETLEVLVGLFVKTRDTNERVGVNVKQEGLCGYALALHSHHRVPSRVNDQEENKADATVSD